MEIKKAETDNLLVVTTYFQSETMFKFFQSHALCPHTSLWECYSNKKVKNYVKWNYLLFELKNISDSPSPPKKR